MRLVSRIADGRIHATNLLLEMDIEEYGALISENLRKNEFQRRRVASSRSVYSLLRTDLIAGCVMPPIVLALSEMQVSLDATDDVLKAAITQHADQLIILDGLQRTYTILDLLGEVTLEFEDRRPLTIRVEVYVGISRMGVLYRMLTLNTGQTPMSLRQQIEMLYADYRRIPLPGVELITESDGRYASRVNQYAFNNVVEGFNSYLTGDEAPIDRADVLENIRSLEKLATEKSDARPFEDFVMVLNAFISQVDTVAGGIEMEVGEDDPTPFGRNVLRIFKRAQAIAGLGAALAILEERNVIGSLDEAAAIALNVYAADPEALISEMNTSMEFLKYNSKKIGSAQRAFFVYYFRDLFNQESDAFLDLTAAARSALKKYQTQIA